jgi:hypothetical protein
MVPVVVIFAFDWWERKRRNGRTKSPQAEKLLRPPGHSLSIELDELVDHATLRTLGAFGLCELAGALFFNSSDRIPAIWSVSSLVIGFGFGVAGACLTVRVIRDFRRYHNLRLGLRGEQAVAEASQEVADCGYRAFHDFPGGENWNIDHIVVGPPGVFLIETKARSRVRPRRGQQQAAHVVYVLADALRFPNGDNLEAIPQAERNAKWLAGFLTKKTGENVEIEALVVLPGWFVETKQPPPNGTMVMNANYLAKYLRGRPVRLPESQVRRIIAQLDDMCRDMEF